MFRLIKIDIHAVNFWIQNWNNNHKLQIPYVHDCTVLECSFTEKYSKVIKKCIPVIAPGNLWFSLTKFE